jgi:PAS domain S-box-containing protein
MRLPAAGFALRVATFAALTVVATSAVVGDWSVVHRPRTLLLTLVLTLVAVAIVAGRARSLTRALYDGRRVLAESEIRYRRLYDGIAAGVLEIGADGRLRQANPAMLRMLAHATEDELLARDFADDVYAGPGTLQAVLLRTRSEGELANVEVRLRRRDGRTVVGLATIRAVWDEHGATAAFEATLIDVTDMKLAESQRRSMELRFRRLFDSNSVGVLFGNLQRRTIDDANDYLLGLLGLRRTELPLPIAAITPDDFFALDREKSSELTENGSIEPFQKEYLHRDGTRVPALVSAALVDPARGDFIGVAIDRTAEVAAARRVEETKAFYELLLDAVPTRIAAVDANERVLYWNRAYRDWFGTGEVGRTIAEAVGPARYAVVAPQIRRVLAGETLQFETQIVRDGQRHALDITYTPTRDACGAVTGFLSFVHDLTPHRELEDRIRENQRLEAVTQLAAGIAHDFHNLLSVVIGNLQQVERRVADDPSLAASLDVATRAAMRGAALTRRFMTFSRPDVERAAVRPSDVIAELVPSARDLLGVGVELECDMHANDWRVDVDPVQLENALLNLLSNARDAMPDGGRVRIECRDEPANPARANLPGEHVVVAVVDEGCGMTPDVLAHAFEPFFSTKHHGRGTGLGLAMVHGFARHAGGAATVESAPGRGTRIELWLPRAFAVPASSTPRSPVTVAEAPDGAFGKPRVQASRN